MQLLDLMFLEASSQDDGKQPALIGSASFWSFACLGTASKKLTSGGVLAALSDGKIAKAPQAVHGKPARQWILDC